MLGGLELEEHVQPGVYTTSSLVVGAVYKGAPPEDIAYLVDRLCAWLNEDFIQPSQDESVDADLRFYNAVFAALLAHLYLVWIHPFGDGNGRTARLVEVAILAHSGVVPWLASNLLSDHYSRMRQRYYQRLADASRKNDTQGFIEYAVEGYVDVLREQIQVVKEHLVRIPWTNFVHDRLRDHTAGETKERRRNLLLDMPPDRPVTKKQIRSL